MNHAYLNFRNASSLPDKHSTIYVQANQICLSQMNFISDLYTEMTTLDAFFH